MKEDINGSHFLLTLGYEYLKQNWEHKKKIFMVYHNVEVLILFHFALNH